MNTLKFDTYTDDVLITTKRSVDMQHAPSLRGISRVQSVKRRNQMFHRFHRKVGNSYHRTMPMY